MILLLLLALCAAADDTAWRRPFGRRIERGARATDQGISDDFLHTEGGDQPWLFEGDMIVSNPDGKGGGNGRWAHSALSSEDSQWPGGVVYYEFRGLRQQLRAQMRLVMDEYEKKTCLRFRESATEPNRTVIRSAPSGCGSTVGLVKGGHTENTIRLGEDCFVFVN